MTVAGRRRSRPERTTVVCASTGNTAASAAAYASRAASGGRTPAPRRGRGRKVAQAVALGARVVEVRGGLEALAAARALADRGTHVLVNSLNDHRLEGRRRPRSRSSRTSEARRPSSHFPTAEAATSARTREVRRGRCGLPALRGRLRNATTVASAIRNRIPRMPSADEAVRTSGGHVVALADDAILQAWRDLAHEEGVLCEPSSAAGLAALAETGVEPGTRVVCVLTGTGSRIPTRLRARARCRSWSTRIPTRSQRRRVDGPCPRTRPGEHGQPRAWVRLRGRRARPVERARGHRGRRRRRPRPPRVRASHASPLRGQAVLVHGPDTARARARLERGRHRSRTRGRLRSTGRELTPEELLAEGSSSRVTATTSRRRSPEERLLTWESRIARPADRPPAVPIALVPDATVSTAARDALPEQVSHADASFTAARAALLGAALATGSRELFAEALADRLHEPHRAAHALSSKTYAGASVRSARRDDLARARPSSSGPETTPWRRASPSSHSYPEVDVLLPASPKGAHAL